MAWQRRAITACAVVAVLAGAVFVVAGAVAADDASRPPADSTSASNSNSASLEVGASSAYRSRVTITLDEPTGPCASFPDADRSGPPHRVCGPILACYRHLDGPQGPLGLPTEDERPNHFQPAELGDRAAAFRGGTVFLQPATGKLSVGRWYAYSPTSPTTTPEPVPRC